MEIKREESGTILPFVNIVTDGFRVVNVNSEGLNTIYTMEGIMLAEVLKGIEYLSQQIYERGKGKQ